MTSGRNHDPRLGLMLIGYDAILASVPTVREPGEHGPLTAEEISQAAMFMDELAAHAHLVAAGVMAARHRRRAKGAHRSPGRRAPGKPCFLRGERPVVFSASALAPG